MNQNSTDEKTYTMLEFMIEMRRIFHLTCGFDIGLHPDPGSFCYALRSRGGAIEKANNFSQGELWRLNPEPDWSDPSSIYDEVRVNSEKD